MSETDQDSDFYVGYSAETPPGISRFLVPKIVAVFFVFLVVTVLFGFFQKKMDRGSFDFGVLKSYEGILYAEPIPVIRTQERTYLLVGDGKFGALSWVNQWKAKAQNHPIQLMGTLIERTPIAMLEINRHTEPVILSSEVNRDAAKTPPTEILGEVDLEGELVDSKCYLGVMRPGAGKVHKGCAIRCLSGGVPPGILLRNSNIDASVLIMLGAADGSGTLHFNPEWAARTVHAHGILEMKGGIPILLTQKLGLAPHS